ncbi:MAG: bifunctional chorismate mutase/prephenate dehydratase [Ruminococcaceae bacterium]|nr:bifunctional chorismate mutase/prephenate dehydratase [Oscillospiraceae bacterium]
MSLIDIRKEIDAIDRQLVPLIQKRMACSLKVAEIKRAENLPVYHPEREKQILDRVEDQGGEYGQYVRNIYRSIMTVSRALQNETLFIDNCFAEKIASIPSSLEYKRVICQGAEGAFSHAAAINMFGDGKFEFYKNFEDVFTAVSEDETAVGILPVENSTAGYVTNVYDLMLKYGHWIVKATALDVSQNLMSCGALNEIKTVYSHPHALKQCSRFIKEHNLRAIEFENTALAAKYVAELNDPTVAAIGSATAGELYGLPIVSRAIQDETDNITRFIAISKNPFIDPSSNKVSLAFEIPHEKGSLYSMLGRFADLGLNLTKIESRPAGHNFEYRFYIDFAGNVFDRKVQELLSSLEKELSYFVFLGNYVDKM